MHNDIATITKGYCIQRELQYAKIISASTTLIEQNRFQRLITKA